MILQKQYQTPKSVLKNRGQRSRGYRVTFNESCNKLVEPDYIILFEENGEPQFVSIRSLQAVSTRKPSGPTLSPPDGYKDCFSRMKDVELPASTSEYTYTQWNLFKIFLNKIEINRKMVNTIWFLFDLVKSRKGFSMSRL